MYKKIMCTLLTFALLIQVGCYSARKVTLEEVMTNVEITEIIINTSDSLKLLFEKPHFSAVNDTLKGEASVVGPYAQISESFEWNIPLSDITTIETNEFDGIKTLIFTGATIISIVVLFLFITLASGGIMSDWEMKF